MCFSSCAPCLLLNGVVTFLQDMLARAPRHEYSLNLAHPQTVRLLPASCKCGQTQGKEWLAAEGGTPPGSCARSVQVWSTLALPFYLKKIDGWGKWGGVGCGYPVPRVRLG